MKFFILVTALAVVSAATTSKNATTKMKPKRQLDILRTPHDLKYSLVLPHSKVTHYKSIGSSNRRISNLSPRNGKLPPYAVQMEPVVQYSQKDPLYDGGPSQENIDESLNKNEIYAQPKISNVYSSNRYENDYGQSFGGLPTSSLYSPHHNYYEEPEPIIEIIIRESNETLPPPPPQPIPKKKKEPVQVFYVKYSKDPHSHDKVVYDQPIPAVTPSTNDEDEHEEHQDYVTVTPEPYYSPPQTTTLRAIIKPESEVYHTDGTVKISFGSEVHHHDYNDKREARKEDHSESSSNNNIAFPRQSSIDRSARPQNFEGHSPARVLQTSATQNFRPNPLHHQQFAQSRIQFQQPFLNNEQQLPRQSLPNAPFKAQSRPNSFGPTQPSHIPGPVNNFAQNSPPFPGPVRPFPTAQPRPQESTSFLPRPNNPPQFAPRPHFNGPPRPAFHSGPQRPFHPSQPQSFFDEAKYLQENYHTITTDQVDPPKEQNVPQRQPQNFNFALKPTGPPQQFQDNRPPAIPSTQLLPQQRPYQQFQDNVQKATAAPPTRSPFYNLKPGPPRPEESRVPFNSHPQGNHFSFHNGPQQLNRPNINQLPLQNHHFHEPSPQSPVQHGLEQHFVPQPTGPPQQPQFNYNFRPPSADRPASFHQQRPEHQDNAPRRPENTDSFKQRPESQENFQRQPENQDSFPRRPENPESYQNLNSISERPTFNYQQQSSINHQQNIAPFVPNGGELIASIPKYEQHITVSGPSAHADFNLLGNSNPSSPGPIKSTTIAPEPQYNGQNFNQQQHYDAEQEQVRIQLAENVKKQQEEIQRLQSQLAAQQSNLYNFHQTQPEVSSYRPHYSQERSRVTYNPTYSSTTSSPIYYQSTSKTVDIRPSTQKYVSSTINSIPSTTPKPKEEKKKPTFELPDEVPDDLREQLLSSGILDNADISVLDYDKVGDTPLSSLPADQLANFFSAGGAQQLAASEMKPIIVTPDGESIQSRLDSDTDDQDISASDNIASYAVPEKEPVEMKVVHFDPSSSDGEDIAKKYVRDDATKLDPVALNDSKYNRYLPLKVSGNQFPVPEVLKGKKVTSVVVLAPVDTETLSSRPERATDSLKNIKFVSGDSLKNVLRKPSRENFERWLEVEKKTSADNQSVVLLVTGDKDAQDKEIFMYDISTKKINKLDGGLSSAFVDAAENNSFGEGDIESLTIQGEGTKLESTKQDLSTKKQSIVPSSAESRNQLSISSGYSRLKGST